MPKTQFVDNSILTPEYQTLVFGTDAITGHRHTGTNDDGSVPKINLSTDIDVANRIENVNLLESTVLAVDISFDGGSVFSITATTFSQQRIGNFVFLRNNTLITGTKSGGNGPLIIRQNGGGNWSADFFGNGPFISTTGQTRDGASYLPATWEFTALGSNITLRPGTAGVYADTFTIQVEVGACFSWFRKT